MINIFYTHLLMPLLLLHHHCVAAACSSLDVVATHAFIAKKGMLQEFHLGGPSPLYISIAYYQSIVVKRVTVVDHDPVIIERISIARSFINTCSIGIARRRRVFDQLGCHRQWLLANDTQPAEAMGKARAMERMFVVIFFGLDIKATIIHQLAMNIMTTRSISGRVVGFVGVGITTIRP
jgi:hypothetical protein